MRVFKTWMAISMLVSSAPAGLATAQSPVLPVQGTLRSTAGNLINDTQDVTFRLYNQQTGGTPFWQVDKPVTFVMGQFVAYLGDDEPINPEDFDGLPEVWLGIQVAPETVEMTPRVRLGTAPFALYAQICGSAESAEDAQTAVTANGLACSGCVSFTELDTSTRDRIDAPAGDVNCSGCVSGSDINPAAFSVATYSVANLSDDDPPLKLPQRCLPAPVDAIYCALSHVSRSSMIQPDSGVSRYCDVAQVSGGWQLCARGGRSGEVPKTVLGCFMTCLSLR